MCRRRYTEIPELGIKPADELKLLTQNSTFFISSEDIGSQMIPDSITEPDMEMQTELPEIEEIVFASTNFVKQNDNRKEQMIERQPQEAQQTSLSITGVTTNAQTSIY